jgi:hypothetical protein
VTTRHLASFLPFPIAQRKMDPQADDQQKLANVVESETQIVDSPDALVLSSDPNHVRPSPPLWIYAEATINKHNSQQISSLNSVKLSTI